MDYSKNEINSRPVVYSWQLLPKNRDKQLVFNIAYESILTRRGMLNNGLFKKCDEFTTCGVLVAIIVKNPCV